MTPRRWRWPFQGVSTSHRHRTGRTGFSFSATALRYAVGVSRPILTRLGIVGVLACPSCGVRDAWTPYPQWGLTELCYIGFSLALLLYCLPIGDYIHAKFYRIKWSSDVDVSRCLRCAQPGGLRLKRASLSTPVAVVGWVLVVFSVLGMWRGVTWCAQIGEASQVAEIGLTRQQIQRFAESPIFASHELSERGLTRSQEDLVDSFLFYHGRAAQLRMLVLPTSLATSVAVLVGSFVTGTLAWILLRIRWLIVCSLCNAVHAKVRIASENEMLSTERRTESMSRRDR